MPVRPPHSQADNSFNVLEYEMQSERASALGRQGLKMEAALAALKAWGGDRQRAEMRAALVDDASDAVWAFFIQREMCGLRNGRDIIQRYQIPGEVLAKVGVVRK
jgi:hypothetical protein